jgi:hypothetical protein
LYIIDWIEKFSQTQMGKIFLFNARNELKKELARIATVPEAITSPPGVAKVSAV